MVEKEDTLAPFMTTYPPINLLMKALPRLYVSTYSQRCLSRKPGVDIQLARELSEACASSCQPDSVLSLGFVSRGTEAPCDSFSRKMEVVS